MKNLWILTEERPKKEVLEFILERFASDKNLSFFFKGLTILPILQSGKFTFTYEVIGFNCPSAVRKILIKTISGTSSFVDYMVFHQEEMPLPEKNETPLYLIEETKSDDSESRNMIYQRSSKFVFLEHYYPKRIPKIMLFNQRIPQKPKKTASYKFATRCLKTIGVEVVTIGKGKEVYDPSLYPRFNSVEEVIEEKNAMGMPKNENDIPIRLTRCENGIEISGKLRNRDSYSDPSIGTLSLICFTLRKLNYKKDLIITRHCLEQSRVTPKQAKKVSSGKFLKIANSLDIKLQGLKIPVVERSPEYWYYAESGNKEKLGTIFIHLVVEEFTNGYSIFENHAGGEKGYFKPKKGDPIPLRKYTDTKKYKAGDKTQIYNIPDLILIDLARSEIINIEGKTYANRQKGIVALDNYDAIEKDYIRKHYPEYKIIRTVVLYGGAKTEIVEIKVSFLLNKNGDLILSVQAPEIFKEAIKNLRNFWSAQNV